MPLLRLISLISFDKGYKQLHDRKDIVGLGCLTHARRKFCDVFKISKNKEGVAFEAIERLKPLYELEARMREANYNFDTRKHLRQKSA
ncbi:MAG: transposase [Gammaproteobacteria bacterium]|nr:transposase [Gammaproteobacteria bacterium]